MADRGRESRHENAWSEAFHDNGYLVLPGFYDYEAEIRPIQLAIQDLIRIIAEDAGIDAPCDTPEAALSNGVSALVANDRSLGGRLYDAVKQIPEFVALVASPRNRDLFRRLRPGSVPGIAAAGFGIRMDLPGEDRFRAFWHQEFPAQLRSLDGIVFWSPLISIVPDLGPVEIARKSHLAGPLPVYDDLGDGDREGAYRLRLANEAEVLSGYDIVAPCTEPGDCIVIDYLTLHQSGRNVSDQARWSIQFRYFNFLDPTGRRVEWTGSFRAGRQFEEFFPDLRVEKP